MTAKVEDSVVAPDTVNAPAIDGASFKAKVTEEPKLTSPPPDKLVPAVTVIFPLDNAELGIAEKVLSEP